MLKHGNILYDTIEYGLRKTQVSNDKTKANDLRDTGFTYQLPAM